MTKIEWTDETWNPTRGCSRVSEGCRNCYAERIAARFSGPGQPFYGFATDRSIIPGSPRGGVAGRWTGDVELVPEKLEEPLHWKKPRRVFVDSMSDLFHEKLSNEDISRVFDVMNRARRHTFQVLTKRPERMFAWADGELGGGIWPALNIQPSQNVWLGVSVEDQKTADERIPLLLRTPAAGRFVSYEPALGPVKFERYVGGFDEGGNCHRCGLLREESEDTHGCPPGFGPRLDWLIVGGESGPGARPCDLAWIRSAVRQCEEAGVPCFVKQVGKHPVTDIDEQRAWTMYHPKGGDPAEWPKDLRVREWPGR